MKSVRVVGPGWGYPLVFAALTIPATIGAAGQPGGGGRALFIGVAVAVALFGWWRRGVWFADDERLVVVNWIRRRVLPAEGAQLELVPIGRAELDPDDFDPRRVRTLYLVGADETRVRVRVIDGASGMRIRKAVDALRTVLGITAGPGPGGSGSRRRR